MSPVLSSDRSAHEEDVKPPKPTESSKMDSHTGTVTLAGPMVSMADSLSSEDAKPQCSPPDPPDNNDDDDSSELSELENMSEIDEETFVSGVVLNLSLAQEDTDSSKVTPDAGPNGKFTKSATDTPVAKRVKPVSPNLKFEKDGSIELPYQTVKAIKLPPRANTGPPSENERPYGDANHMNSMLIYWLDEEGMSYNQATQKFAAMFPEHKAVEEAIRRRHIRCLQRLAKTYGVHDEQDITGVSKNVLRRGKKRASRVIKVTESSSDKSNDAVEEPSVSEKSPVAKKDPKKPAHVPKYVRESAKARVIEKLAIVVWKDMEHLSYKDIRNRLEDNHNWSLGTGTIEKYYHLTRPKVYKVISGTDSAPEPAEESDTAAVDTRNDADDEDDKDSIMEGLEAMIH